MRKEPAHKRAIAFFDGQNLFHCAKEAFGYTYPNYDVNKLAKGICDQEGWALKEIRFYTGVHTLAGSAKWHNFWNRKLAFLGRRGVKCFARPLRYRTTAGGVLIPEEKGIDVRIAIDATSLAFKDEYDVAILFTQDQDLSEVAQEIRELSRHLKRWIKIASAYPLSAATRNTRGVNHTDWIRIDKAMYDTCLDPTIYP